MIGRVSECSSSHEVVDYNNNNMKIILCNSGKIKPKILKKS